MKKRLFLAIPLAVSLANKFSEFKARYDAEIAGADGMGAIRWVTKQNLHITVYFFGDVEESKIPQMSAKLALVAKATPHFTLEFQKIIYAPPNRAPRMIWADFGASKSYTRLVRAVYEHAKSYLDPSSAQTKDRAPHPHVTLARLSNPAMARLFKLEQLSPAAMTANKCQLISSELTRSGARYMVMEEYQFA
jgi:2'-5' RNA ligase